VVCSFWRVTCPSRCSSLLPRRQTCSTPWQVQ
jgi:hypothetical protein